MRKILKKLGRIFWRSCHQRALSPNSFVGRAFGIGPIITYSTKLAKSHLDFNPRWIHEFDNRNRVEGDGFIFTASLKF
jgi:hypothetical protein